MVDYGANIARAAQNEGAIDRSCVVFGTPDENREDERENEGNERLHRQNPSDDSAVLCAVKTDW